MIILWLTDYRDQTNKKELKPFNHCRSFVKMY